MPKPSKAQQRVLDELADGWKMKYDRILRGWYLYRAHTPPQSLADDTAQALIKHNHVVVGPGGWWRLPRKDADS